MMRDQLSAHRGRLASGAPAALGVCRVCGCTESRACVGEAGPCWWVEPTLCSECIAAAAHVANFVSPRGASGDDYAHCTCGWGVALRLADDGDQAMAFLRQHWRHVVSAVTGRTFECR